MTRPNAKRATLTKVAKAVVIPAHPLKSRLQKVLEVIDSIHAPKNLKLSKVIFDQEVLLAKFEAHAPTGPYTIFLNPDGSHVELSLLHEVGHFLEWQSIPKSQHGLRDFGTNSFFNDWLQAVFETPLIVRLLTLLGQQEENTKAFVEIAYLLLPDELWTRAYSCYIAYRANLPVLSQQIAAENKTIKGNITYTSYWTRKEFLPIQNVMDKMFQELEWSQ